MMSVSLAHGLKVNLGGYDAPENLSKRENKVELT
jgi:hypothetical protein